MFYIYVFYSVFYVSSKRCLFSTPCKACLLNSTRAEPSQRSSERQLGLCNQFENRAKTQLEVCKEDLKVCACANYLARLCNSWSKVFTLAHRPALQSGEMFSVQNSVRSHTFNCCVGGSCCSGGCWRSRDSVSARPQTG